MKALWGGGVNVSLPPQPLLLAGCAHLAASGPLGRVTALPADRSKAVSQEMHYQSGRYLNNELFPLCLLLVKEKAPLPYKGNTLHVFL